MKGTSFIICGLFLVFSSIVNAESINPDGSASTELYFSVKDKVHTECGYSSTPVNSESPYPTPITGDIILSVDEDTYNNGNGDLVGRGQCYLYWDIFSPDGYQAQVKIQSGAMELSTDSSKNLDWAILVTRPDGETEYAGPDSLKDSFDVAITGKSGDYTSSLDVFEYDRSSSNVEYYKLDSALIQFVTADAKNKPRGTYEGVIQFEVQTTT